MLILGDISLNPGSFHNLQPLDHGSGIFSNIEDYIIFTSISVICCQKLTNRHIAKITNAVVIGISESKLGDSLLISEIQISNRVQFNDF